MTSGPLDSSADPGRPGTSAAAVVRRYWERLQARDWPAVASTLHPAVELDWVVTAELIAGREAVVEINRVYPEGWSIEVLGVAALGDTVVSEVEVAHPPAGTFRAASFWQVEQGVIRRGVEYWVQVGGEEPPEWRRLPGVTRVGPAAGGQPARSLLQQVD